MSFPQHFLSGGLSGLASVLCLQPFDLLKTRVQQVDAALEGKRSVFRIVRDIVKNDGPIGLWRGTAPTLLRNVPGVAVYLTTLQKVRTTLSRQPYFRSSSIPSNGSSKKSTALIALSNQGNLLAGAISRTTVGLILNPVSVVKARVESDIHSFTGLREAFGSVFKGGYRELFRGAFASALRDAPYAALFLFCYENLKREFDANLSLSGLPPTLIHGSSAAVAGTFATLSTQPFDVLKTKIQVRKEKRYSSIQSAAVSIWRQRGIGGFFDGASLRLTRKVLSSAVGWMVYEGVLLTLSS